MDKIGEIAEYLHTNQYNDRCYDDHREPTNIELSIEDWQKLKELDNGK